MRPSDFLQVEEHPIFAEQPISVLNTQLVDQLRQGPVPDLDDLEAGHALVQLARDELEAFGTGGGQRLNDEDMTLVLRANRALLGRLDVAFELPFRDFRSFRDYWREQGMSGDGGYARRRGVLNDVFQPVFSSLEELEDERSAGANLRGVDGQIKNLIFGSTGPKPVIVLRDALNNVVEVTSNAEYCLFYDRPIGVGGLTWGGLVDWWRDTAGLQRESLEEVGRSLYRRLFQSVQENLVERVVFRTYCERYREADAAAVPALLPQVYLHFDPLTRRQRGGAPSVLARERMDFLLLTPGRQRIVVEVDGKQHYAEGDVASPRLYSDMTAEDRRLRLRGYEVYRFGGFELSQPGAAAMLREFFDDLRT